MVQSKKNLIKYSLLGFLVFFYLIFILENTLERKITHIEDLSLKNLNQNVLVKGKIIKEKKINETTFLDVRENSSILKVIAFKSKNINFSKSIEYLISGKISYYKEDIELLAEEIRKYES